MTWSPDQTPITDVPEGRLRAFREYVGEPDENGCWPWARSTDNHGYGQLRFNGMPRKAYRLAYLWWVGDIPVGLHLDHLCRNRLCVNPEHLEAVTKYENDMRGMSPPAQNARRAECIRGHAFDEANTLYLSRGGRVCRICKRARALTSDRRRRGRDAA